MERVLVVTETGDAWPSGYVRALVYRDLFGEAGLEATFVSRVSPTLTRAAQPRTKMAEHLLGLGPGRAIRELNRFVGAANESRIISLARRSEVVYLQKTTSLKLVRMLRARTKARLVYDLNDAVWLPTNSGFARGGVVEILKTVDAVTCDNAFGAEFARASAKDCYVVPDPSQVEEFDSLRPDVRKPDDRVVLGWVGSPGTLYNLYAIWEPLERVFAERSDVEFRIVGAGYDRQLIPRFENVKVTRIPWYDRETMIREVLAMHIGLFPLFDSQDSRARGVLKATIYMGGEAATIASPIGQVCEVLTDGEDALLADGHDQWVEKLSWLIEDSAARRRIAARGLETVRTGFTLEQCFGQLVAALDGHKTSKPLFAARAAAARGG